MASDSDISPPPVRRRVRRTPITDRERCLDVVVRDGMFVLPLDARNAGPVAYWLNAMSVVVYNRTGDLMIIKADIKMAMEGAQGAELVFLKAFLKMINRDLNALRKHGYKLRSYVLNVENAAAINEPRNWSRI